MQQNDTAKAVQEGEALHEDPDEVRKDSREAFWQFHFEFLPRIEQILRDREVDYDENEVELLHRNIPGEELRSTHLRPLRPPSRMPVKR